MAVPELMRILLDEAHLGMGRGLGHHDRRRSRTRTTRCCPKRWRSGRWPGSRSCCRASWRSSTRSTAASSTRSGALPGRRRTHSARQPDRGRRRAQDPHGESGDRRLAQHQRRRRDSLRTAAHDDRQGLAEMFPERFNNKTNGVTPRRWLLLRNPALPTPSPRRSAMAGSRTSSS